MPASLATVQQVARRCLAYGAQTAWHALRVKQRLSSSGTVLLKYGVFPLCGLASIGGAVTQFMIGANVFGLVWAVFGVTALYFIGRMMLACQRVFAGERGLLVGGDDDPIEIPFTQITGVAENQLSNPRIVTVSLETPNAYGAKLSFFSARAIRIGDEAVRPVDYIRACVQTARRAD